MDAARKGLSSQCADVMNTLHTIFSVAVTLSRCVVLNCWMKMMQSINLCSMHNTTSTLKVNEKRIH